MRAANSSSSGVKVASFRSRIRSSVCRRCVERDAGRQIEIQHGWSPGRNIVG